MDPKTQAPAPEPGAIFANATLINDEGYSEIVPGAPVPAAPAPASQEAVPAQPTPPPTPPPLAVVPPPGQPEPQWYDGLPEFTLPELPTGTSATDDGFPDVTMTEEQKQYILGATSEKDALTRTQEVERQMNKTWHDRYSQALGKRATSARELERERDMYKAIAMGQRPSSEMPPVQPQTQVPVLPATHIPQTSPPSANLSTLSGAVAEARKALLGATEETYPALLERYEQAQASYFDARAEEKAIAAVQGIQKKAEQSAAEAKFNADADKSLQYVKQNWTGDIHRPIPFAEAYAIFEKMAERDRSLVNRMPMASFEDRADWILRRVGEANPRLLARRTDEAINKLKTDLQTKNAAAPIMPGTTSPLKNAGPATPASNTQGYLDYLKANRDGG